MRKLIIRLGLTGIVLTASLLLISSDRNKNEVPVKEKNSTCCKKTVKPDCGTKPKERNLPVGTSLDNLSEQFISLSPLY